MNHPVDHSDRDRSGHKINGNPWINESAAIRDLGWSF